MTALSTVADVYCTHTGCTSVVCCTICPAFLCPNHSDEYTTCVASDDILHHVDCEAECPDCSAASAQDDAEDRHDRHLEEGY